MEKQIESVYNNCYVCVYVWWSMSPFVMFDRRLLKEDFMWFWDGTKHFKLIILIAEIASSIC